MGKKLNCWEFNNCGREKDGVMVPILGECRISSMLKYDGLNDGVGAGRACWMVKNLKCTNRINNNFKCYDCKFYKRVIHEEAENTVFKYTSIEV